MNFKYLGKQFKLQGPEKNMNYMRYTIIVAYCLFLAVPFVFAENQMQAHVFLTVLNPAPSLENVSITSPAYSSAVIQCSADVIDNNPSSAALKYAWKVNKEIVSHDEEISGVPAGAEVLCEVTAVDAAGQESSTLSNSTIVQNPSVFGITAAAIGIQGIAPSVLAPALFVILAIALFTFFSLRKKNVMIQHHKI